MRQQFFGTTGLTSTSANHIANMAKEFIQSQEMYLNNLCLVNETTQAGGNSYQTGIATPKEQFNNVNTTLQKVSLATQLISWLREALKEKSNAQLCIMTFDEWCNSQGIELKSPNKESYLTREAVIERWDVNKLNSYLQAQTFASVFGKFVHIDGTFNHARKELTNVFTKPVSVEDSGMDITVRTKEAAYTLEEVDAKFFELQNLQREYQAKFNKYEHEITTALEENKAAVDTAYASAYASYRKAYDAAYAQYNVWKNQEVSCIANYKIVIPEALVGIYNEISGLGK